MDAAKNLGQHARQATNEAMATGKAHAEDLRSSAGEKLDQAKTQAGGVVDAAKQTAGQAKERLNQGPGAQRTVGWRGDWDAGEGSGRK